MLTRHNIAQMLPIIKADPATSFWLKQAIEALEARDANDAADDAGLLHAIFEARLAQVYGRDLNRC